MAVDDPATVAGSVITVDNHVALPGHMFDVFTGKEYGSEMLRLPVPRAQRRRC